MIQKGFTIRDALKSSHNGTAIEAVSVTDTIGTANGVAQRAGELIVRA